MASRKAWATFFACHTDSYPNGVIGQLVADWQQAQAEADKLTPPPEGSRATNRDTPQRIARMLAERLRRKP